MCARFSAVGIRISFKLHCNHTCPSISKLFQYLYFISYHSNMHSVHLLFPITLINYFIHPFFFRMNFQILDPFINNIMIRNFDSLGVHIHITYDNINILMVTGYVRAIIGTYENKKLHIHNGSCNTL